MSKQDELTISPKIYQQNIYTAHNTEAECFEAGKRVQLEHDRAELAKVRSIGKELLLNDGEISKIISDLVRKGLQNSTLIAIQQGAKAELAKAKPIIEKQERERIIKYCEEYIFDVHIATDTGKPFLTLKHSGLSDEGERWQALKGD